MLRILNGISHDTEVLIKTDTFGKEELLVAMADHLQALVHSPYTTAVVAS